MLAALPVEADLHGQRVAIERFRCDISKLRCANEIHKSAEQRNHLKTTNPLESTFSTVRLRTSVTKGGSRAAGLAMAFKLIQSADSGGEQ